jgi:hypothetical protein
MVLYFLLNLVILAKFWTPLRFIYTSDFRVRFCIKLGQLLEHKFFSNRLNAKSDLRVNEPLDIIMKVVSYVLRFFFGGSYFYSCKFGNRHAN